MRFEERGVNTTCPRQRRASLHDSTRKALPLTNSTWRRKASISFQRARMRSSSCGKFMASVLSCASVGVVGRTFFWS
jgi:hypothetical protein